MKIKFLVEKKSQCLEVYPTTFFLYFPEALDAWLAQLMSAESPEPKVKKSVLLVDKVNFGEVFMA